MKVILLQDVAKVGKRLETVEVPAGHARNFLLPKGMAEAATPENVKKLEAQKATLDAKQTAGNEMLKETCAKLSGTTLAMPMQANEQGHLFKGVSAADIAEHVTKEVGTLGSEHIQLDVPIKEVGEHTINVAHGDAECTFTLNITTA